MPLLYGRLNRLFRRLTPVVLPLMAWMIFALSSNLRHEFRMAREGREQGAVLARMFGGDASPPSVAVSAAGAFKSAYTGEVNDLTGRAVAERDHRAGGERGIESQTPFDREAFHEWHPDILIRSDSRGFEQRVFQGLLTEWQFRKRYIKGELWYNGEIFFAYFSRRFINGLEEGYYAFTQDLQYALSMEDWPDISDVRSDEELASGFSAHNPGAPALNAPLIFRSAEL
jgi:hypothetical protein